MTADISVAVVNFNSSQLLLGLLDSLFRRPVIVEGLPREIEVIVVDNASRPDDRRRLEDLRDPRVRLILNDDNVGYAVANNQAFEAATGRWHVVSNPDVIIGAGCLEALIETVETKEGAALAGPLASMDRDGTMLMPPNELPDPYLESVEAIARHAPAVSRWRARCRSRQAHDYWTADHAIRHRGLSGCFFLGRRSTIREHGLFDPGYPLYYEDLDLFRRYDDKGLGLWHVPQARIVHFWSRSAETSPMIAAERNRFGAERYFLKFFGEAGLRVLRSVRARAAAFARDDLCAFDAEDLGGHSSSPVLQIPESGRCFLEVSATAKFSFSVGIFPRGDSWSLPDPFWNDLPGIRLWCRAIAPSSGETLKAWTFRKALTLRESGEKP